MARSIRTQFAAHASVIAAHNRQDNVAQLPYARSHDVRHVHATTLLLAGVPVHVVAE